jgi:hypothetical protein
MNILLITALVGGYYLFNSTKDDLLNKIKYRFGGVAFDGIGGDLQSVRLIVRLIVDNGTALTLPIDSFEGVVFFKDKTLTPIKSVGSQVAQSKGSTNLNYQIEVGKSQLETVFGSWQTALKQLGDAANKGNYRLKGQITFRVSNLVYYQEIDMTF